MRLTLYSRLFARIYDPFMEDIERRILSPRRKRLISQLEGRILDIGSGTGINFPHFHPHKTRVIAAEPSEFMMKLAMHKMERGYEFEGNTVRGSHIELIRAGMGDQNLESMIDEGSLDAIVSTLVLCTIPDPKKAIELFYRWLRPGGTLILLEHIRSHRSVPAMAQRLATPVWSYVAEGCRLDRPTDQMVQELPFAKVHDEYFQIVFPFYEGVYRK